MQEVTYLGMSPEWFNLCWITILGIVVAFNTKRIERFADRIGL